MNRKYLLVSPDVNQVLGVDNISEPLHPLQRSVVTLFGVRPDAIAYNDHEIAAMIAVPHRGFDPTVGGATDHHDCFRSSIREHRLELIADEHGRPSLVDDDVVFGGLKRLHDLPAKAAVKAAWCQLAGVIDFLGLHEAMNPSR